MIQSIRRRGFRRPARRVRLTAISRLNSSPAWVGMACFERPQAPTISTQISSGPRPMHWSPAATPIAQRS